MKGAEAINAYMGHSTVQDTTIVSVVGRVIHKQMTIDAEDINGKTRYNSAVLYRSKSGKLRAGIVTKFIHLNGSLVVLMKKPLLHNDGLKNVLHLADDVVNAIRSCYLCAKIVDNFEVVPLSAICEKCVYLSNTGHSRSTLCLFSRFPSHLLGD